MSSNLFVVIDDPRFTELGFTFERATSHSAGMDLRAMFKGTEEDPNPSTLTIEPRQAVLIPTGLRVWVKDPDSVGLIHPRSGTGHKRGLVLGNGTGVIDADYQGPLMISALNRTDAPLTIELGERIAQFLIMPILKPLPIFVKSFDAVSERGDGGFGSTGTK